MTDDDDDSPLPSTNCKLLGELCPDLKWSCCGSCHTDADDYDYSLSTITVDGKEIEVCCEARSAFLRAKP